MAAIAVGVMGEGYLGQAGRISQCPSACLPARPPACIVCSLDLAGHEVHSALAVAGAAAV